MKTKPDGWIAAHLSGKTLAPMTDAEREEQRRSFAYGNTHLDNPEVTREMVDEAAESLDTPEGGAAAPE